MDRIFGTRGMLLFTALMMGLLGPGTPPSARAMTAEELVALRVNIAGRQRLLSQRILAAACFTARGIDAEKQGAILAASATAFAEALDTLENGSAAQDMPPVEDEAARARLAQQRALWTEIAPQVAAARDGSGDGLSMLADRSAALLKTASETVAQLTVVQGNQAAVELGHYIDLAGRQRMLSQRMVANACLTAAHPDALPLREQMAKDAAEFSANLVALASGDPARGIIPAPTMHMLMALDALDYWWAPVRNATEKAQSAPLTDAELEALSAAYEPLLDRLEEAVWIASEV